MEKSKIKKVIAWLIVLLIIELEGLLAGVPVDSTGVKWVNGNKFTEYKVEEHEGWFAIARKCGVSYGDLRIANKELTDTLHIGQVILIPNAKKKVADIINPKSAAAKDKGEPVYYTVKQKETLYAISKKYHVSANEIKTWNQLTTKDLKKGQQLIVGYKKAKQVSDVAKVEEKKPEKKEEVGKSEVKSSDLRTDTIAREKKSVDGQVDAKLLFAKNRKAVEEQGVATWIDDENINPNKYFALHRSAPTGTIIKVMNRMNKRSVFVKVVGKLPDTGDNENIIIKISKASAEKLGVRDQRFQAELAYGVSEK